MGQVALGSPVLLGGLSYSRVIEPVVLVFAGGKAEVLLDHTEGLATSVNDNFSEGSCGCIDGR